MNGIERLFARRWLLLILLSLVMLLLGGWYSWDVARFVASLAQMPETIVFYKGLQYLPGLVLLLTVGVCKIVYSLFVVTPAIRWGRYGTNVGIFIGLLIFFGWPQFTSSKVHHAVQIQGYRYCEAASGHWSSLQAQVYVPGKAGCPPITPENAQML